MAGLELSRWQVKKLSVSTGDTRRGVQSLSQEDTLEEGMVTLSGESMDRGAWGATVHWVSKSQTLLKRLSLQYPRGGIKCGA